MATIQRKMSELRRENTQLIDALRQAQAENRRLNAELRKLGQDVSEVRNEVAKQHGD